MPVVMTLSRFMLYAVLVLAICGQASSVALLGGRLAHLRTIELARSNPALHFQTWLTHHNKDYANDADEVAKRLAIWLDNLEFAAQYNAKTTSHWIGLNHLADLTQEEYRTRLLGYDNAARLALKGTPGRAATPFRHGAVSSDTLPPLVDWRQQGAVSAVKNQEQCGSCWAFSTTGAVEGANAIYTGTLETLSEQELVDCDRSQDQGCNGGLMDFAYQFIIENGGLDTEADYPYTAQDGVCDIARSGRKVVSIDSFEDVPENDEEALKKAVAHQPVAVAIEADQKSFQLYVGGVYDDEEGCGTVLDHGVLVVGYGKDPHIGLYWIVKNSWGGDWGEKGYIRIKMGAVAKEGLCGIAMAASYPIKTSDNPPATPPTPVAPSPEYSPPAPGPGPDEPVVCDDAVSCRAGATCCCAISIGDTCAQWGCCPYVKATCCDDHQHCCPSDVPVCDLLHSRCVRAPGDRTYSVPWALKEAAIMTHASDLATIFSRRSGPQDKEMVAAKKAWSQQ